MNEVYFHLQSASVSGFAVGEIWRAFAHTAFHKESFTAYYGPDSAPIVLTLASGDYWVQLKLPHGELIRELVNIPDQKKLVEVILRIPQPQQPSPSTLSPFSPLEPVLTHTIDTVVRPPVISTNVSAALPDGTKRTRSVKPRSAPQSPPTFTIDRFYDFESRSGEELLLKSRLMGHFSLTRVVANFLPWPRRPYALTQNPGPGFVQPNNYFTSTLRYATEPHRLSVIVDGDSITAEIPTLDHLYFESSPKDLMDGRFKRDLVIVKDDRNQAEFLVTIPNGWRGNSVQLRITKNASNFRKPLNIAVEVKDPKFNALLQFIKGGDLDSAIHIIESSVELLYAKFNNPFAAAAAGYVLIQAAPRTLQVPWQVWIGNLGRHFGNLPDGEILHATLLLQRGDAYDFDDGYAGDVERYFPNKEVDRNNLAAKLILSALGKGPPMFRSGLSLLASNLRILSFVELPQDVQLLLAEGERLVTWLSMRVDPIEPFSVFHIGG